MLTIPLIYLKSNYQNTANNIKEDILLVKQDFNNKQNYEIKFNNNKNISIFETIYLKDYFELYNKLINLINNEHLNNNNNNDYENLSNNELNFNNNKEKFEEFTVCRSKINNSIYKAQITFENEPLIILKLLKTNILLNNNNGFNKYIDSIEELQKIDENTFIYYIKFKSGWMFKPRDLLLFIRIEENINKKDSINVIMKSVEHEHFKNKSLSNTTRIYVNEGIIQFKRFNNNNNDSNISGEESNRSERSLVKFHYDINTNGWVPKSIIKYGKFLIYNNSY